jgi:lysophospholipase L1-like esterase
VVDNLALVSASAKTMLKNQTEHWQRQLAHRGPDLTVVMLGSNESIWLSAGKRAMADYQAQYETMLAPIRAARPVASCLVIAPLDQVEEREGKLVGRAVIPMMVDAQRKAAHAQGCAFWNAFAWMGGRGSALRWNRRGLMNSDFHHLSQRGSAMLADGLVAALVAGYGTYKAR